MNLLLGWDIGGVNTKLAVVEHGHVRSAVTRPFELQRAPASLVSVLREMADEVGGSAPLLHARSGRPERSPGSRNPPYVPPRRPGSAPAERAAVRRPGSAPGEHGAVRRPGSAPEEHGADPATTIAHAVTMTAELSQMFRTKREGVAFVLDALEAAFPRASLHVYSTDGLFLSPADARARPLAVAAANWMATAAIVAETCPDAVLIDVGTTTTDIIPIVGGQVAAIGRTDPDRLASGELVYTGAVRTPVEAIVSAVPLGQGCAGVSAEGFALAADVHVWRGVLDPSDYSCGTPDGRPATREFVRERLARIVCADVEMLDDGSITRIADAVATAQMARVSDALRRVLARHPSLETVVTTGLGAFIAEAVARDAGLRVVSLAGDLGHSAARCAPATAVALLLWRDSLGASSRASHASGC